MNSGFRKAALDFLSWGGSGGLGVAAYDAAHHNGHIDPAKAIFLGVFSGAAMTLYYHLRRQRTPKSNLG